MKTILLPTDFSSNAHNAIKYALSLWSDEPVHFILLNAYYLIHSTQEMLISVEDILRDNSIRSLQKELMFIDNQTTNQSVEIETISRRGEPVEVIKKIIIERDVDLVVMGTKGSSGLQGKLIGSNTAHLINKARCPIIIVPGGVGYRQPKRIAFAAEMDGPRLNGIEPLLAISKKYQSQLMILNVASPKEHVSEQKAFQNLHLNGQFKGLDFSFHLVEDPQVVHGINDFIKQHDVDLLVVVPGDDNLLQRLFHPSVSKALALHTKTPLLVL